MLNTISAFVATVAGKAVLTTAAVAVGVGGVHATGVVDVPGLPDPAPSVDVDAPAVDDVPRQDDHGQSDTDTAQTDRPGVDGDDISDRAQSGEPQENGREFGGSVADEAREGTPAEDRPRNQGADSDERRPSDPPAGGDPDVPSPGEPGNSAGDDSAPVSPNAPDAADEDRSDDPPSRRP